MFASLDRPALRPLPAHPYEFATWKSAKVDIDYHLEVDRHWYSVPYRLVGQHCDIRVTATIVEVLHKGRRVASHRRSTDQSRFTTEPAHMPESHRRHAEWTPGRIVAWAERSGPATGQLVTVIMASRRHPEQGFRSCLGIMRLGRRYGDERLEAAAVRTLAIGAHRLTFSITYQPWDFAKSVWADYQSANPAPEPPPSTKRTTTRMRMRMSARRLLPS